jgi:hypothetical protein
MYINIIDNLNTIGILAALYATSNGIYFFQRSKKLKSRITLSLPELCKELTYNNSAFYLLLVSPIAFSINEYIALPIALIGIFVNIKNRNRYNISDHNPNTNRFRATKRNLQDLAKASQNKSIYSMFVDSEKCEVCVPYEPKGICAPMQPIGSCINCGNLKTS